MSTRPGVAGTFGLAVGCALVLMFLAFPIAVIVPISFSTTGGIEFPPPGYDFNRYFKFFAATDWIDASILSARVALAATVLAIPVGVGLALALVRGRFRGKGLLNGLLLAPLIVPVVIYALALFFFYRQIDLFDSELGLVLTYSVISLPYIVLVTAARLKSFDESLEIAAMSLGASWLRAVWQVTLPLTWSGVFAGALFAFIHAFDELLIALFVTGYRTETLPRKMFSSFTNEIDPLMSVVSSLLIALSIFIGVTAGLAGRKKAV